MPVLWTMLWTALPVQGAAADSAEVILFFTGDVQANFEPCGCAGGPTGGLARRVGYANSVLRSTATPQLHVDAGNYFADPGPNADAINHLMLNSLDRIPLAVLNLGVQDLHMWPKLAQRQGKSQIISTNLVPRRSDLQAPRRYAIVEIPVPGLGRPVRVGFMGLADPQRVKPNSGFRAQEPLQAVAEIKAEVIRQADLLVVLWDTLRPQHNLPEDWIVSRLAREHPEVSMIITTEPRFVQYEPLVVDHTTIVSTVERGRYLGQATWSLDGNGRLQKTAVEFIEMKDGVPEEPGLLEAQRLLSARLP